MKTVLVTGATRGLGLDISITLAKNNYQVIAIGRNITKDLEKAISDQPNKIHFVKFDLEKTNEIHDLIKSVTQKFGRLYGLINNAALGLDGVLTTQHESEILRTITVNTTAPIILSKYASRSMLINKTGRIINISSIIATTGFSGLAVYGATKASMIGFTKSFSREMGKMGITVNSVSPGYMQTDMTSSLQGQKLESIKRRSPSGKLPKTSDVAQGVLFLLSENASAINGTNLTIDEGSTA